MSDVSRHRWAEAYAALLAQLGRGSPCAAAAEEGSCGGDDRLLEMELQGCWQAGLLGAGGETEHHGVVRIVDFGTWNRSSGPDFFHAEIELDGRRLRGDIELDISARDWESLGHGCDPDYDRVVLHVVLGELPVGWFTRNSRHEEVPVLRVDSSVCRRALGASEPLTVSDGCLEPLATMPREHVGTLLQGAAFYRMLKKRRLFRLKCEHLGPRQSWYEAWAESLGYRANKMPMLTLARRAPICELGQEAEAILFGTAGFLMPLLPPKASAESRQYHRQVWDAWWPRRDRFALSGPCCIPWSGAPVRPLNHPHRRVAALALSVLHWEELEPLLRADGASGLMRLVASWRHPYWSRHCMLPSVPLSGDFALVGQERVRDFLVNHVYVQDESDQAWELFLKLRERHPASRVRSMASRLFGEREDLGPLLQSCYAQQALLQIEADLGATHRGGIGLLPVQLQEWSRLCRAR